MSKLNKPPVITIDGPSGTGKGTMARMLAADLTWFYLDSGALYRVLGFAADKHDINISDEAGLVNLAKNLAVEFPVNSAGDIPEIYLEGENVSHKIRTQQWGSMASKVGAIPSVRTALLARQRDFQKAPGLVTDGRDMGTVIFPNALVKIYLTASLEERAKRRCKQLQEGGNSANLAQLLRALAERDQRDSSRAVAPLKPAQDAVVIDTTDIGIDEVISQIRDLVKSRLPETP